MKSAEGEKIQLKQKVNVNEGNKKGNVELWLSEVETAMKVTMKGVSFECLKDQLENMLDWPG